jgi:signal transduction histidine kinase
MAHILVIDDEPAGRELLVTLLAYYGHRMSSACDGAEGFALAIAERPDLIITDILMPKLDGYALAARVRADPALAHSQIIFYSAIDLGTEIRQLAANAGVTQILTKPAEPETVVEVVHAALASSPPPMLTAPNTELDHAYLRQLTSTLHQHVEALKAEIQARKQAELALRATSQQLQDLSLRLVAIQEAERRHLARELHDEIGQMLTGLNLLLETGSGFSDTALVKRLREAQSIVTDLTTRVRTLSLDLRPSMLDDLGLLPTLLWYIERYTAQTGVQIVFKHRGLDHPLSSMIAIAVYRVVQEALTNIARYAQVTEAVVAVWTKGSQIVVSIEDQGHGFDLEAALASRHSSGLAGMRERVTLLGGRIMVDTAPGQGARILVELPLSDTDHPEEDLL